MNREGAETFLRLLAEAQLRDQLAPDPPPWAGGPGAGRVKFQAAGQALTAVGALDREIVEEVLADFDLAVSLRRLHGPGPRPTPIGTRSSPADQGHRADTGSPGQAARAATRSRSGSGDGRPARADRPDRPVS